MLSTRDVPPWKLHVDNYYAGYSDQWQDMKGAC